MSRSSPLLALTLAVACAAAHAQAPPEGAYVSIHRVRLAPGLDGDIVVTEALRLDTPAGRHGITRRIPRTTPLGRRVRIDIIAVTNGTLWQTGYPLRYAVAKSADTIAIDIGDPVDFLPPGPDHQYRLDYRVSGAVESTRDGDRFVLELGHFDVPVRPCGYWVVPPGGTTPRDLHWRLFRAGRAVTDGLETQAHPEVLLVRDDERRPEPPPLEPFASERVEIAWAASTGAAPPTARVAAIVADARPLLATLALPVVALALWAGAIRRRSQRSLVAALLAGGELPPAVAAGPLVTGRIGPRDHAATALELVLAGVLDIGTDASGRPTIARGAAPIGAGPLADYEAALVATVCPDAGAQPIASARVRLRGGAIALARLANRALDDLELLAHPLPPRSGALALAITQGAVLLAVVHVLVSDGALSPTLPALAVAFAGAAWALAATRRGRAGHALAAGALATAGWLVEPHQLVSQDLPLALQLGLGAVTTSAVIAHLVRRPAGEWCGRLGWAALGRLGELAQALDAEGAPPTDEARTRALCFALDRTPRGSTDDTPRARVPAAEQVARALVDPRITRLGAAYDDGE